MRERERERERERASGVEKEIVGERKRSMEDGKEDDKNKDWNKVKD